VKFAYARYSETVVRPVIRVQIRAGKRSADYELLVDSGADITILDAELAADLGIDVIAGFRATVMGATGEPQDTYIHPVTLKVGSHSYKTHVAFMPTANPYGLAGQRGFFDHFRVTFDLKAEELELSPYRIQGK
jgi:Aspartyl protease